MITALPTRTCDRCGAECVAVLEVSQEASGWFLFEPATDGDCLPPEGLTCLPEFVIKARLAADPETVFYRRHVCEVAS